MAFEIVDRGVFGARPLQPGRASVAGASITLRAADLAAVGIKRAAVVLVDAATRRLALRVPRENEESKAATVSVVRSKKGDTGRRRVYVRRALAKLGLDPEFRGAFEISQKDDLLTLQIDG